MAKKKETDTNSEQRGSLYEESKENISEEIINSEPVLSSEETSEQLLPPLLPEDSISSKENENIYAQETFQKQEEVQTNVLSINIHDHINMNKDESVWYEIVNAYRTQRILSGTIIGTEHTGRKESAAVIYYKGLHIFIPVTMMSITDIEDEMENINRKNRILNLMLGAEIDFIVKSIDDDTRTCTASRTDAMQRKRRNYYININASSGKPLVHENRIVQARIISVFEKSIRVEIFGVETNIIANDLSFYWIADLNSAYNVGDNILVKINKIEIESIDNIQVSVDVKTIYENDLTEKIRKIKIQSRYIGKVVDIRKGLTYVQIENGINVLSGVSFDQRTAGINDLVSCIVTNIDIERKVVYGVISKIIKQNI